MLKPQDIAIISGARTPMGRYCGKLRDFTAQELGAIAGKEAIRRAAIEPKEIDHVVFGNAQQTSGDALYGARHVALKAGLPQQIPALTVNRLCGSGMQSIVSAAQMLQLGEGQIALAGGSENMTQAPHVLRGARSGYKLGQAPQLEDSLWEALVDSYVGCGMAITAENLAEKYGITREEVDRYALRSQTAARRAQQAGLLAEEIVPVTVKDLSLIIISEPTRLLSISSAVFCLKNKTKTTDSS